MMFLQNIYVSSFLSNIMIIINQENLPPSPLGQNAFSGWAHINDAQDQ